MAVVSVTLAPLDVDAVRFAAASYIAGYSSPSTPQAYRTQLRRRGRPARGMARASTPR